MKRKLVKQGESTLMMSVPRKWVLENALTKGDEVTVERYSNALLITTPKDELTRTITITLNTALETEIRAQITAAYRAGYDKVHVQYTKSSQLSTLQHVMRSRLIGYEITEQDNNTCTVEMLSEVSPDLFQRLLRKIFFAIEQTFECLTTPDKTRLQDTAASVQRFDNFCKRLICTGQAARHDSEFLYAYLLMLVHGQRELYYAAKQQQELDKPAQELLKNTQAIYELLRDAYLTSDSSLLSAVHEIQDQMLFEDIACLQEELSAQQVQTRFRLLSAARRFYQANSQLVAVLLSASNT